MLFLVVVCCLSSELAIASVLSLVAFCVLLVALFLDAPQLFAKYLPFVFGVVANVAGCAACEFTGVYLDELDMYAGYAGSLPLLILSRILFLEVVVALDVRFGYDGCIHESEGSANAASVRWLDLLTIGCTVVFAGLFAQVAMHPSFLEAMNRFSYQRAYGTGGAAWTVASYLIVFPLMSIRRGDKLIGSIGTTLYLLRLIWTGNKFGSFFTVLCLCAIVFYDKLLMGGRERLRQIVFRGCIGVLALVVLALTLFTATSNEEPEQYFAHRLAEQGQLWWGTYAETGGETHVSELADEVDGLLNGSDDISSNVGAQYGIYKIMYLVAPASQVNAHLTAGARYTEGGYASAYYYFGALGPVMFAVIMAVFAMLVVNLLLWSVVNIRVVSAAVLVRLLALTRVAQGMATFSGLIEPLSLLSYCVVAVALLTANSSESYVWRRKCLMHKQRARSSSLTRRFSF